jgi:hypothetical protein
MALSPSKLVSLHCIVIAKPPTKAVEDRSDEEDGKRGSTLIKSVSSMILLIIEVLT